MIVCICVFLLYFKSVFFKEKTATKRIHDVIWCHQASNCNSYELEQGRARTAHDRCFDMSIFLLSCGLGTAPLEQPAPVKNAGVTIVHG